MSSLAAELAAERLNGATYLVIGRQVTREPDPKWELQRILDEVRQAPRG